MGSQGDAVRERLWTRLRDGAQGSHPLRGTGVAPCSVYSQLLESSLTCVSMQSQKEKAKNFKSQIIKYLESLLQSQHQVSQTQKSSSARLHVQNSENNSRLGISCSWLQLTLRVPDNPSIPNLFSVSSSWSNTGRLSYLKLKQSLNPPAALQMTDQAAFSLLIHFTSCL